MMMIAEMSQLNSITEPHSVELPYTIMNATGREIEEERERENYSNNKHDNVCKYTVVYCVTFTPLLVECHGEE
jgi:hypothetical protein